MDALEIIFDYFESDNCSALNSLMQYLDVDTLVAWFVDEGYVDDLYDEEKTDVIMKHYEAHC